MVSIFAMERSCTHCRQTFEITEDDLAFLDTLSPVFNGEKEIIPPPQQCPDCRLQRRLCERNTRNLYYRKCDLTGKQIISQYNTDQPFPVYGIDAWESDAWDGLTYGRDFDFSRPFFDQFHSLLSVVPHLALFNTPGTMQNSDYNNQTGYLKNCYLLCESDYCEDCYYSNLLKNCRDTVDCSVCYECERCYECIDCIGCHNLLFSKDCQNCADGYFLQNCIGCRDCIGCINQRQKQYMIFNVQYSKEEYEAKKHDMELVSRTSTKQWYQEALDFFLTQPHRALHIERSEASSGDRINHCKNVFHCFDVKDAEDCRHSQRLSLGCKSCMDYNSWGQNSQLVYQSASCGDRSYASIFCSSCITVANAAYSFECFHCRNIFGCVGLRLKEYCILNKQYTKEEYEELVPRIIEQMKHDNGGPMNHSLRSGSWGEYFPQSLCTFAYNESFAPDIMPLSKEEALRQGWRWYERKESDGHYMGTPMEIPETISETGDEITTTILPCGVTGKLYKITPQELAFYRSMDIPVPALCPDERHRRRTAQRNPYKLWQRNCAKCQQEIQTSYAPGRVEFVYCDACYFTSVY